MKVAELSGKALDYWVAKAIFPESYSIGFKDDKVIYSGASLDGTEAWSFNFHPSEHWAQGGKLIEEHRINLSVALIGYTASVGLSKKWTSGSTPLEAAMRVLVLSVFGEEVEE